MDFGESQMAYQMEKYKARNFRRKLDYRYVGKVMEVHV